MTTITDGFTRTGADALGTSSEGWSWTEVTGDIDVAASGVEAEVNNYGNHNWARAESDLASANHYAQARCTQWNTGSSSTGFYVHARFASASNTSLVFYSKPENFGSTYRVFKQTAGAFTQIGSTVSAAAPTTPFTQRIEVDSSNNIKGFINGSQVISVGPDSFNSTAVRTGVGSVPISATVTLFDDFEAGDLTSGTTVSPTSGHVTFNGKSVTIDKGTALSPTSGHVTFNGKTPTVSQTLTLSPTSGHVTFNGKTPTIDLGAGQTISPASGHVTFNGKSVTIDKGTALSPTSGHITFTGKVPTVSQATGVTARAKYFDGSIWLPISFV